MLERVKGFEPSTSSLGRKHSATELHPQTPRVGPNELWSCVDSI